MSKGNIMLDLKFSIIFYMQWYSIKKSVILENKLDHLEQTEIAVKKQIPRIFKLIKLQTGYYDNYVLTVTH